VSADVISQGDRQLSHDSVSMRDYVDIRIAAVEDTIEAEVKRVDQIQNTQTNAVAEATRIATDALNKRLEGMNEFRAQMNDWAARFITREDVTSSTVNLGDRITKIETSIASSMSRQEISGQLTLLNNKSSEMETFRANIQGRMVIIGALAALFPILVEVLLHFIK